MELQTSQPKAESESESKVQPTASSKIVDPTISTSVKSTFQDPPLSISPVPEPNTDLGGFLSGVVASGQQSSTREHYPDSYTVGPTSQTFQGGDPPETTQTVASPLGPSSIMIAGSILPLSTVSDSFATSHEILQSVANEVASTPLGSQIAQFNPTNPTTPVIGTGLSSLTAAAVVTVGSRTVTPQPISTATEAFRLGSILLSVGGTPVTVEGHEISVASGGLVVDSSMMEFIHSSTPTMSAKALITIGTEVFDLQPASGKSNILVIGSITMSVGGPPTAINGQPVRIVPSGVVVGSDTHPFASIASTQALSAPNVEVSIVLSSDTIVAKPISNNLNLVIVGDTTLSVGGSAIKTAKQTLSAIPGGIIVGTDTLLFTSLAPSSSSATSSLSTSALATGSLHPSLSGSNIFVAASTSLTVGRSAATISGQVMSAASSGLLVVTSQSDSVASSQSSGTGASSSAKASTSSIEY